MYICACVCVRVCVCVNQTVICCTAQERFSKLDALLYFVYEINTEQTFQRFDRSSSSYAYVRTCVCVYVCMWCTCVCVCVCVCVCQIVIGCAALALWRTCQASRGGGSRSRGGTDTRRHMRVSRCITLTATHCNMLQHTSPCCNM